MRLIGIIVATILLVSLAYAGENYTISGKVSFQYDGDIYICLFTSENLSDFNEHPLSRPECKAIRMNSDLKKAGKAPFKLDGVPKGTYTILAIQDVNGNQKVDYENYIIDEPWGSYRAEEPGLRMRDWEKIKFDLNENITGIEIEL